MKPLVQFLIIFSAFFGLAMGGVYFVFMDSAVMGHSGMAPTLLPGDQFAYWKDKVPAHGDIAVCTHPEHAGEFVVGRVVAIEGMRVSSDNGVLAINGRIPEKDYKGEVPFSIDEGEAVLPTRWGYEQLDTTKHMIFDREGANQYLQEELLIPPGKVYLVGDNRLTPNYDSRSFGPVDKDRCIGIAAVRIKTGGTLDHTVPYGRLDFLQ